MLFFKPNSCARMPVVRDRSTAEGTCNPWLVALAVIHSTAREAQMGQYQVFDPRFNCNNPNRKPA